MTRIKTQQVIQFEKQVAEIELVYKPKIKAADRPRVTGVRDAVNLFRASWNPNTLQLQEQFKVMYLNRAWHVLGIYPVCTGTMTGTIVDCQLIMTGACLTAAKYISICHNHPSGSIRPSKGDKEVTQQIGEAASLLGIVLLDHIILTEDDFLSFASEGLLSVKKK